MQGGSGWDDAVTPGKEKGAGPGARGGDAETPGGDGYHGGDAVGPGGAPGAPGYSPAYGRSPGFSPQGEPMGRDMPEVTAMAIADAIFDEIRNSGTEHKPPEVTDRQLELLAFVFDEKHLEHALVIVQKRMLKKLVGTRSRRTCWQVRGKSGAKEEYLVYPTHYCSCRAFQWDVLSKGEQLICKHMLAVRVAEALDDYNSVDIDDALLAQMLEAYANESAADGGGGGRGRGPPRGGGGGGGGGGGVRRPPPDFHGNVR